MTDSNDIESTILLRNNIPYDEFFGLTPNEIHNLLYETFGDKSPVQFRNDIDNNTLDQIPLFRIAEEYLKIIHREKQIKLTPLGALQKKVVVEIYDKRILLDEDIERGIIKINREEDWTAIRSARLTTEIAGLVKKTNGKLSLTKSGTKLIQQENRLQLFKLFFQTFTGKFFWGFNDLYTEQPVGQLGWAFSALMLNKFGDQERTPNFYAEHFLKAFPKVITFFNDEHLSANRMFKSCYGHRTFDRFFIWFGLVTVDKQNTFWDLDKYKLKRTDLLKRVFNFDA